MSELEIKQLITKCLEQDRSAQRLLYKTFYGFAKAICLRYSNNSYEAAEIINEGFFKVFKNLDRYTNHYSFKPWLAKIMVNTSIDYYRNNSKTALFEDLDSVNQATNEVSVESKMNYHDLLAMVQRLSPAYRAVFNMFAIDGYSHEEISKVLNINTGTSKSNLFKARAKLKEMILKINR